MMRGLQIAVAWIFLLLALATSALWVRSYYWTDEGRFFTIVPWSLAGGSSVGRLVTGVIDAPVPATWRHNRISASAAERKDLDTRFASRLGFGVVASGGVYAVMWPNWFVALVSVALAAAARGQWTYRFSLRVLFTVITLVAGVLGAAAVLSRSRATTSSSMMPGGHNARLNDLASIPRDRRPRQDVACRFIYVWQWSENS
jgi:hypothetical protein